MKNLLVLSILAHHGGAEEREDGKDKEVLHDGAKRLNRAQCMHGAVDLESAECGWFRRVAGSIQAARGELILVPAEIVAEFVQVGEADLPAENIHVPPRTL